MSTIAGLDHYHLLGRTGLRVSRLALGTMTFGTEWGWGADETTARRLFDAYVDAGGNFFDTADLYTGGTSERWLGTFIKESGLRDRCVIATKSSYSFEPGNPNAGGNGRKAILRAVEGSLARLGTDYLDLYILHTWDTVTPVEEVLRTLDDLVRTGKVRHVGLSNVPAWYTARAQTLADLRQLEPVSVLQLEYSLVERAIEHEFVPLALDQRIGIMAWSPLASGFLSGKYRAGDTAGRLETMKESTNPAFAKRNERNERILEVLEAVAAEIDRPVAQVALNWVANRPGVASVLIGATKPHQLDDNLQALTFALTADQQARLDAASAPEKPFPYSFFEGEIQEMVHGCAVARG